MTPNEPPEDDYPLLPEECEHKKVTESRRGRPPGPGRTEEAKLARLAWLRKHPDLWIGWGDFGDARERAVFARMQADGLYSFRTVWYDAGISRLVGELRRERRAVYAKRIAEGSAEDELERMEEGTNESTD